MKSKKYSYGERVEMLESELDVWSDSFKTKTERFTAALVAFSGSYFDHGGPAGALKNRKVSDAKTRKKMEAQVKRLAQKYKVPALRYTDDYGEWPQNIKKKYFRKLPIG